MSGINVHMLCIRLYGWPLPASCVDGRRIWGGRVGWWEWMAEGLWHHRQIVCIVLAICVFRHTDINVCVCVNKATWRRGISLWVVYYISSSQKAERPTKVHDCDDVVRNICGKTMERRAVFHRAMGCWIKLGELDGVVLGHPPSTRE